MHEDQPTEVDPGGYINNVYISPPKPVSISEASAAVVAPEASRPSPAVVEPSSNALETSTPKETPVLVAPAITQDVKTVGSVAALGETSVVINPGAASDGEPTNQVNGDSKSVVNSSTTVSDLANTIAARDGTTSAVGYVTSAIGAVIQNVVGLDPVNPDKVCQSLKLKTIRSSI